jgi:hypothetical protein
MVWLAPGQFQIGVPPLLAAMAREQEPDRVAVDDDCVDSGGADTDSVPASFRRFRSAIRRSSVSPPVMWTTMSS